MIIVIQKQVNAISVNKQAVVKVRIAEFNIPSGILTSSFTQKGSILVGVGDGQFLEMPPGTDGEYLQYDSSEMAGIKTSVPTIDVADTTNHLINGGFDFAQRTTPGTLTTVADGGYGADQWKMTRENADLQYIRVDGSGDSDLTSPYYGQFKKITNAGKILICQPLEYMDTLKFRGKTVNFQLKMKASAAKTIKIAIVELQTGGTADTLPALVSAWGADSTDPTLGANLATIGTPGSCSVTTAWQTFQFTGAFPASSKNLLCMVWSDADFAANDTLSLAEAGLYFGSSLRSWTPRHVGQTLKMCERFYQKSYDPDTVPNTNSQNGTRGGIGRDTQYVLVFDVGFKTTMRLAPTITLISQTGTAGKISIISGANAGTGTVSVSAIAGGLVSLLADSGSGFTAGTLYRYHFTAEAGL